MKNAWPLIDAQDHDVIDELKNILQVMILSLNTVVPRKNARPLINEQDLTYRCSCIFHLGERHQKASAPNEIPRCKEEEASPSQPRRRQTSHRRQNEGRKEETPSLLEEEDEGEGRRCQRRVGEGEEAPPAPKWRQIEERHD